MLDPASRISIFGNLMSQTNIQTSKRGSRMTCSYRMCSLPAVVVSCLVQKVCPNGIWHDKVVHLRFEISGSGIQSWARAWHWYRIIFYDWRFHAHDKSWSLWWICHLIPVYHSIVWMLSSTKSLYKVFCGFDVRAKYLSAWCLKWFWCNPFYHIWWDQFYSVDSGKLQCLF